MGLNLGKGNSRRRPIAKEGMWPSRLVLESASSSYATWCLQLVSKLTTAIGDPLQPKGRTRDRYPCLSKGELKPSCSLEDRANPLESSHLPQIDLAPANRRRLP